MKHVVVVGAGQAGSSLAFKLRALGHEGPVTLIGEEALLPYQRPPLTKAYLLGEMAQERLYLRPEASYRSRDITLQLGQAVTALDPAGRRVWLGERAMHYDDLVLATGSSPTRLPDAVGGALDGIYYVRTLSDIDAMSREFAPGRRVLIVGGGYIGLEAAAVAATKGLDVTLIEMAERILKRVAAPETADYFRRLHRDHGVTLLENARLESLQGEQRVRQALLADGRHLEADFIIVGAGIRPNVLLAQEAGLTIDNGIWTDRYGRTSAERIWAAGDCTSFPFRGTRVRLESVPNAIDQAEAVAANILGAEKPYRATPWFWSDQYDVKLQIAGLNNGYDRVVRRAGSRPGSVSHWYFLEDRLLAVDAMNAPRDYMVGKRLIDAGQSPTPEQIADPDLELKSLLKRA